MKLFAFDFDKTITVSDTILPLCRYLSICFNNKLASRLIQFSFILFRLKFINDTKFKEKIISLLLKGKRVKEIENTVLEFFKKNYDGLFNPEISAIISKEKEKGNRIIIITSNLDLFVNPVKKILSVDEVFATRVHISNGIVLNSIVGENCTGNTKAEILNKYKLDCKSEKIIAYGDSTGDYKMLQTSDEGYLAEYKFNGFLDKITYQISNLNGKLSKANFKIIFKKL